MPKILVALDGFAGSEKALEAAVKLAQQNGGEVTAVSVLDRPANPHLERLAAASHGRCASLSAWWGLGSAPCAWLGQHDHVKRRVAKIPT